LVAAIELVSPGNKDRAESRRAFAAKCVGYLTQGIGLIIVDVVTNRHANLHDEVVTLLRNGEQFLFPFKPLVYATAYRPVHRDDVEQIDVWLETLAVGQLLRVLPLALTGELSLRLDLESTYQEACRKLRLIA
jgi:hypothetical protein